MLRHHKVEVEIWSTHRHFEGTEFHFLGLLVVKLTSQNAMPFGILFHYKCLMFHPGLSMESLICHTRRPPETVWNERNQWS